MKKWSWQRPVAILALIVVAVVVYAFGFEKTKVDLSPLTSDTRRGSLVRIMRTLAHPNIFEYDETDTFVYLDYKVPCPTGGFTPASPDNGGPYLVAEPTCADPGATITISGYDFPPSTKAPVSFIPYKEDGSEIPLRPVEVEIGEDGAFTTQYQLPDRPSDEIQRLRITTTVRTGSPHFTAAAKTTWDKIIETVMLALMATTLGIMVAIPLSFFSARNLMRSIRSPLLSVSLFVIGLPLGVYVGVMFGRLITTTGDSWYRGRLPLAVIALIVTITAAWLLFRTTVTEEDEGIPTAFDKVRRGLVWAVLGALAIYALLVVGYVLIGMGSGLSDRMGAFDFIARFFGTFGDLITTFMRALTASVAGLVVGFLGSRLGQRLVDRLPRSTRMTLRYPAAALAVALMAYGLGWVVDWLYRYHGANQAIPAAATAALLAVAGGGVATRLGRVWTANLKGVGGVLRFFVGLAGIALGAAAGVLIGNLADRLLGGQSSLWAAALVGALLGLIATHFTRKYDALPTGLATYYASRSFFNAIRSVEPLVMAIVFVVWVSTGPFAGSLALALHTVAALAKLYSEQVESIMAGPIEAVTATGATRLQNVVYAVVPQIVPPYIAFTLYRWDINVRMSTIIGFAGGGGIGFVLQQNINLGKYGDASIQMLAIAVVVAALDFISARVRERIV